MSLEHSFRLDSSTRVWVPRERVAFDYTDGEANERYLLDTLKATGDVSTGSAELVSRMIDWPSTYHLTPRRGNLLRPFAGWFAGKRMLEIGCGCGAITRFLGEAGAQVVSVEGSMARATIARERCRDLDNVEVICATSEQVQGLGEFDAVLLIGVLEYARKFLGTSGTELLLQSCRSQLSKDGVLFVAIENQLGLKYFAGAGEDHVGIPMFGVEERYVPNGVTTFGRRVLSHILTEASFTSQQWWYPFPDYKLPLCVLSEPAITGQLDGDFSAMITQASQTDPQRPPTHVFSPERAWPPVYRNGIAHEVSNSFLVLASNSPIDVVSDKVAAFQYAVDRLPTFAKAVEVRVGNAGALDVHYSHIANVGTSADAPITAVQAPDAPFYKGEHWQQKLVYMTSVPGWRAQDVLDWYTSWVRALLSAAGLDAKGPLPPLSTAIDGGLVNALPHNLIISDGGVPYFFGLQYRYDGTIELGYLMFRALYRALGELRDVAPPAEGAAPAPFDAFFRESTSRLGAVVDEERVHCYVDMERAFELATQGHSDIDYAKIATSVLRVNPSLFESYAHARHGLSNALTVADDQKMQLAELLAQIERGEVQSGEKARASQSIHEREQEIDKLRNSLRELQTEREVLERTRWFRLYAALAKRPLTARSFGKGLCLIVPAFIRRVLGVERPTESHEDR